MVASAASSHQYATPIASSASGSSSAPLSSARASSQAPRDRASQPAATATTTLLSIARLRRACRNTAGGTEVDRHGRPSRRCDLARRHRLAACELRLRVHLGLHPAAVRVHPQLVDPPAVQAVAEPRPTFPVRRL